MNKQQSFKQQQREEGTVGTLYLVGTPIGNLEDMTYRAIRTLQEVDIIAAEDTRQTRKLLTHFDIHTKMTSYHEHNKHERTAELINRLLDGVSIAIVSDAGLPAISDPGEDLVKAAIAEQIAVVPIPGANAALSALIISGLSTERFTFVGFPPRERKLQQSWVESIAQLQTTLIIYEAPHRIKKTCQLLYEALGDRQAAIARELTKRHEEVLRGTLEESVQWFAENDPIGEYVLIIEGVSEDTVQKEEKDSWWQLLSLEEHVATYEQTMSRKEAIKQTAVDRGVAKRDVYNIVNRAEIN
ncbi:16S rRNA (cytidine(1402)-2'-O)-methyltransferase [Paenibacillus yanchengensis]|uniref:Ribosomal RNA small subunit methyltransferase I n=1 Tax=Paenibacillus yanchengensis TaxID=2035833 RepID=A0ABW4YJ74_9BACL